jgi:hypothetical protein
LRVNLTMTPPTDLSTLLPSEKDALIKALLARVEACWWRSKG